MFSATLARSAASRSTHMLALALLLAAVLAPLARAFECSACQYTARNCSALDVEASSTTAAASDTVAVCDATGKVQLDDVFCDDDDCQCADGKRCASLVFGCANIFQARSRKRCIGDAAVQRRYQKCAVDQGLTTANATLLASDWVFYKDPAQCSSRDCDAVRQFHQSGVVQCGYLIVAWKDSDALYHFVVDGSRASDMSPGVFHYQVPFAGGALEAARLSETRVQPCFALQTRNQASGEACDGYYIEYDTAVQFSHTGDYQLSKLSWPVWCAVVGSVAAAVVAVAGVALAAYRFRRADAGDDGADDELLRELDAAGAAAAEKQPDAAALPVTTHDLRQRALSPRRASDDSGAPVGSL